MNLMRLLCGAAIGAGAMYFLDPRQGAKRRARVRDQARSRLERAELAAHQERIARYGREPMDVTIRRVAAEYGLDDAELRAEYEQIQHRLRSRRCAR